MVTPSSHHGYGASFRNFTVATIGKDLSGIPDLKRSKTQKDVVESNGGDDTCAMTSTFAVLADGVGGGGHDSKIMSQKLISSIVFNDQTKSMASHTPVDFAYMKDVAKGGLKTSGVPMSNHGSTTLCMAKLSGTALTVSNIGDSGALLLRPSTVWEFTSDGLAKAVQKYTIIFRTTSGASSFNCPHQISMIDGVRTIDEDMTGSRVHVRNGDLLIMASDGVFDNLWDHEIVDIVNNYASKSTALWSASLAGTIAANARVVGELGSPKGTETPFAKAFRDAYGTSYGSSGKLDDVSVCVGVIELRQKKYA